MKGGMLAVGPGHSRAAVAGRGERAGRGEGAGRARVGVLDKMIASVSSCPTGLAGPEARRRRKDSPMLRQVSRGAEEPSCRAAAAAQQWELNTRPLHIIARWNPLFHCRHSRAASEWRAANIVSLLHEPWRERTQGESGAGEGKKAGICRGGGRGAGHAGDQAAGGAGRPGQGR